MRFVTLDLRWLLFVLVLCKWSFLGVFHRVMLYLNYVKITLLFIPVHLLFLVLIGITWSGRFGAVCHKHFTVPLQLPFVVFLYAMVCIFIWTLRCRLKSLIEFTSLSDAPEDKYAFCLFM